MRWQLLFPLGGRIGSGGDGRSVDGGSGALAGKRLRRRDAFLIRRRGSLVIVAVVVGGRGLAFFGYDHVTGGSDERVEEIPEDEGDLIRSPIGRIDSAQSTG